MYSFEINILQNICKMNIYKSEKNYQPRGGKTKKVKKESSLMTHQHISLGAWC